MSLEAEILAGLMQARSAARRLALTGTDRKNRALGVLANALRASTERILEVNREDFNRARAGGDASAFVDRLTLTRDRVEAIARGVETVAALPDPVGEIISRWRRPNGL